MDTLYKNDEISLLTSEGHGKYLDEIPPLTCWWFVLSPRGGYGAAMAWNGITNYGSGFDADGFNAIRPVIKYTNIRDRIIKSPDRDELFYFNNHTFAIIDGENEIAIALVPVTFDYFDMEDRLYEDSSIRRKLLHWFETGEWRYDL